MAGIYRSAEGEGLVRERYQAFVKRWPVPNQQFHVPTSQGETFVVASGEEGAPALLLFHGSGGNSAMWMGDVAALAEHFRVYSIDMIGEPGLSAPERPPLASDAHALWLDDVLGALAVDRASIVGISLGGWLALDYATRRPDRVASLVVLCPGGVGRARRGIVWKALVLGMCGAWGERKLRQIVLGLGLQNAPPAVRVFGDFVALIHKHFRLRREKLPIFSDDALRRLTMPVLAIVGGKDALLDSAETKRRLERAAAHADVRYLPEAGHLIPRQTMPIREFLRQGELPDRGNVPFPDGHAGRIEGSMPHGIG